MFLFAFVTIFCGVLVNVGQCDPPPPSTTTPPLPLPPFLPPGTSPYPAYCSSGTYRCNSGKCIPKNFVCDRDTDCEDGDDEGENICGIFRCDNTTQFKCATIQKCISISWVCDFDADCADASDEVNCNKTCPVDKFQCVEPHHFNVTGGGEVSGIKCINQRWVCDGGRDCQDGSDEVNCTDITCSPTEFKCKNSTTRCITASYVCDGDNDCGDLSDEQNCAARTCPPLYWLCADNKKCVRDLFKCDGEPDCNDQSDEWNCTTGTSTPRRPANCSYMEFRCNDGQCIPSRWRCDHDNDCNDHSDEANCTSTSCHPDYQFACPNEPSRCLSGMLRCDGHRDCTDGSDEANCPTATPFMTFPIYPPSIQPPDPQACKTVGTCSQICEQQGVYHVCKCEDNFELRGDYRTCRALGPDPTLLLIRSKDILELNIQNLTNTVLVSQISAAKAADYIYADRLVYVYDADARAIFACRFALTPNERVTQSESQCYPMIEAQSLDSFSIDWVHHLLFFTDYTTSSIYVATLQNPIYLKALVTGVDKPRAIRVDPKNGYVFFAHLGRNGKFEPCIERIGMDGSNRTIIVNGTDVNGIAKVEEPIAIVVDYYAQRLFWADEKLQAIYAANYDGTNIKRLHSSDTTLAGVFSLAIFEDTLYWSDLFSPGIHRLDKFTGELQRDLKSGIPAPLHLRILQPQAQPEFPNKCARNNCTTHLCLPIPVHNVTMLPYICTNADVSIAKTDTDQTGNSPVKKTGHIVGAIFFVLCVVLVVGAVGCWFYYRRRQVKSQFDAQRFDNPIAWQASSPNVMVAS